MAGIAALAIALPPGSDVAGGPVEAEAADKPNLILILTDDQRADLVRPEIMPETIDRFPVEFPRGYATTPVCCPSRASILTGRYAHDTGVHLNTDYPIFRDRWEADSLAPWLQSQGYYTGLVGKYLNKYSTEDPIPPGWDEFYGRARPPGSRYAPGDGYKSILMRERNIVTGEGENNSYSRDTHLDFYSTDHFADRGVQFLERAKLTGKPWALFIWTTAPHIPRIPNDTFQSAPVPPWKRFPSFKERDISDKPTEIRYSPMRKNKGRAHHQGTRDAQMRMLMSVDLLVERVFDTIDALGESDHTWGFFASDNGWLLGEHGLEQKMYAYEESSRVPFRMTYPGAEPRRIPSLVANVDIAPTFVELAGETADHDFDGTSLVPLVTGAVSTVRSGVLIEGWHPKRYRAIRTAGWLYVHWKKTGHRELYDMVRDPFQLRNLAARRKAVVRRLHRRMVELARS